MNVSAGWWLLIGGVIGAIRCAAAKKFYQADFMNLDGNIADEAYVTEVAVSRAKRWLLVFGCVLVALVGAYVVQRAHNWNLRLL